MVDLGDELLFDLDMVPTCRFTIWDILEGAFWNFGTPFFFVLRTFLGTGLACKTLSGSGSNSSSSVSAGCSFTSIGSITDPRDS